MRLILACYGIEWGTKTIVGTLKIECQDREIPMPEVVVIDSALERKSSIQSMQPGDVFMGIFTEMNQDGIWFPDEAARFLGEFVTEWLPPTCGAIFLDTVGYRRDTRVLERLADCRRVCMLDYLKASQLLELLDCFTKRMALSTAEEKGV